MWQRLYDYRRSSWWIRVVAALSVLVLAGIAVYAVVGGGAGSPKLGTVLVQESVTGSGYTARLVLTNTDAATTTGWTVDLEMPAGTTIVRYWDADMTADGNRYTFASVAQNGEVAPGAMVSFGFTTQGQGTPVDCRVNGGTCVAPADATAPGTPTNLRVTGAAVSSVTLSWDAAQDNLGVVAYRIYGAPDGAGTGDNAPMLAATEKDGTTVSGLTPATAYTFAVSAVDAAGNESPLGDPVRISTAAGDDTSGPSAPSQLRVTGKTATTVRLAWGAAVDNRSVAEYRVYQGADVLGVSTSLSAQVSGLTAGSTHTFAVVAVDDAENESAHSNPVTVTTDAAGATATPSAPGSPTSSASPTLTYTAAPSAAPAGPVDPGTPLLSRGRPATASSAGASADGKPVYGPERAVDGDPATRWASLRHVDPSWLRVDLGGTARLSRVKLSWDQSCAKRYSIQTSADQVVWQTIYTTTKGDGGVDDVAVGGVGRYVQVVGEERCRPDWGYSLQEFEVYGTVDGAAVGGAADKQAPTPPKKLAAGAPTSSGVALSWAASTDNVGVVGYDIYHDGNLLRSVAGGTTTTTLTDLAPNSAYRITVLARDKAGNASQASNMVPVTTLADGDTAAPSGDTRLRATSVTASSVTLEWQAAQDNGDAVSYDVYVGGTKVGTVATTLVVLSGLAADTDYQLSVKARDAAGNNSPASNTVDVTTRANGAAPAPVTRPNPTWAPTPARTTPSRATPSPSSSPGGQGTRIGQVTTVTTGLRIPWGMAFLPDGDALVGERDTFTIYRVTPSGQKTMVGKVPGVTSTGGEGGLLGLALSPRYATDKMLYAYHTTGSDNRVVRMRYDAGQLGAPQVILSGIPRNRFHNGGRIIFGPDGMLYIGTGDAQSSANAQNKASLGGKILRITPDGKPAPGNPFQSPVFSYGHRNVQGLWFDSAGRLWASEFGDSSKDEVNLIVAGRNYGWPTCEGACGKSGLVDPVHEWPVAQASPSGLCIVDNVIFMASLRGTRLWRMEINGSTVDHVTASFVGTYGRLRTILRAPDGSLWLTTSNTDNNGTPRSGDDRILRIRLE